MIMTRSTPLPRLCRSNRLPRQHLHIRQLQLPQSGRLQLKHRLQLLRPLLFQRRCRLQQAPLLKSKPRHQHRLFPACQLRLLLLPQHPHQLPR